MLTDLYGIYSEEKRKKWWLLDFCHKQLQEGKYLFHIPELKKVKLLWGDWECFGAGYFPSDIHRHVIPCSSILKYRLTHPLTLCGCLALYSVIYCVLLCLPYFVGMFFLCLQNVLKFVSCSLWWLLPRNWCGPGFSILQSKVLQKVCSGLQRITNPPLCFLLSEYCTEGPQEGGCCITQHHLIFQHRGHQRKSWFLSMWPEMASLEKSASLLMSLLCRTVPGEASSCPWTPQRGLEDPSFQFSTAASECLF